MLQILLTLITFTVTSITANKLDGIWIPVKQEIGGTILPSNAYEKQKLIISDSNYTFVAESVDKGVVKYQDEKMDIYGKEGVNTGKHFTARYKYEKDELTVCYNLSGDSYPENFETQGKHNLFLCVFKRETEAK
jgi:uncharacterized protein (TIGR03067 family)